MAKLTQTSEDVIKFIEKIIRENTSLGSYITWRILSDNKQKELIKITKSSAVTEYFAKMEDSIIIYVNEEIFDRMMPNNVGDIDYRTLVIEDALTTVQTVENKSGNTSIKITKPEICITSEGYSLYGEELVKASECAVLAYKQILEEKQQQKEEEQSKKSKKDVY